MKHWKYLVLITLSIYNNNNAIKVIKITDYELIFVNDGSPDNSLEHLITLQKEENSKIKIIN